MEQLEKQIIKLIAADKLDIPISSISNKLDRMKKKVAQDIEFGEESSFLGERAYARVDDEYATEKARTIREAVNAFAERYPRHGEILERMIQAKRRAKKTHLYFGVNPGKRLTSEDYIEVMTDLGFTKNTAIALYPGLMDVSRKISQKRGYEERSILL